MPLLDISNADFAYGHIRVLNSMSFHVDDGEIVALVGANGAGKTTVINAISGFNRLTSGSVMFNGHDITDASPSKLPELGLVQVPENRHLFKNLSVEDNLLLGSYSKKARTGAKATQDEIYAMLPILAEKKAQRAGELSGGQQQMLAIGRALMAKPKLMMLDEPSLGLAPIVVSQLFDIIRNVADQGVTVLIVEQNVTRTLRMADRAYAMQEGQTYLSGTGEGLLTDHRLKDVMLGIASFSPDPSETRKEVSK